MLRQQKKQKEDIIMEDALRMKLNALSRKTLEHHRAT